MDKLEKIKFPDDYDCDIAIINDIINDLNDWVDMTNDALKKHEYIVENSNVFDNISELEKSQSNIDSLLFTIRDRISMVKDPLFYGQLPENIQESLGVDLDNLYNRCICRKDIGLE